MKTEEKIIAKEKERPPSRSEHCRQARRRARCKSVPRADMRQTSQREDFKMRDGMAARFGVERLDGERSKERRLTRVHEGIWKRENCSRRMLAFEIFLPGRSQQAWRYGATRRVMP
jgi:hypothetical protein